jgi:decaprenylphospho-beta-D-ribofuranose 2-oxidase
MLSFDEASGLLTAEGGVTLEQIIDTVHPRGWFLPTTPGTKFVTLGGAVASDVHGKNHHVDGTFGAHVSSFVLLTAQGESLRCSHIENREVFFATIGGMGLTGHIVEVSVRLHRVPSAWYRVRYERAHDLDSALAQLARGDNHYRYSVAWIDCLARGKNLGRSVLMLGNEASPDELAPKWQATPYSSPKKPPHTVPFDMPGWCLNAYSVAAFNQAFYTKHADCEKIVDYDTYFYPLDAVHEWNRIYGKRGFVQFQVLFPDDTASAGLREVLEAISEARLASFLAVLKRSGPANEALLSYLEPGFTLALDIPNHPTLLAPLLIKLDGLLVRYRGKVYFAKDTLCSPEIIPAMYPRLDEFRAIKAKLDPEGRIRSHLSERLKLHP